MLALIASFLILAQDFNYERAYADYIYNFDLYKKAYSDYEVAKLTYQQTKTLTTTQSAQEKTAKMLVSRDEVVRTYLTAVRLKLVEGSGLTKSEKDTYFVLIDPEVAWFSDHKTRISTASSLEDLVRDSGEAATRYETTELVIYRALTGISVAKLNSFQDKLQKILERLKAKVAEIRLAGDKDVSTIERWILEVEGRLSRSREKENEALAEIASIELRDRDKAQAYAKAQSRLSESHQYLKEASSYLKQIITEIKTKD